MPRSPAAIVALCLSVLTAAAAATDLGAAPGDARLRHDLQLLADAGVLRAPLSAWPVSLDEIARDLGAASAPGMLTPHLAAAVSRVRAALPPREAGWRREARVAASAEPMRLRRFDDVPREEGEIEARVDYQDERFTATLAVTAVADADDGKDFRLDGSYVGAGLGNWLVSAGLVERWWGPGWEGSLILGTNQRPIPSLTVERNYSDPFETKWLSWLGRWRLAVSFGQLEGDRQDYPDTRFFAMRVTWKPHDRVEVGLSRSAQWCGEGRPCGFDTFWDLLSGNDNDQALEEQPGNQLAGIDLRWSLPWLPLALYGQAIGEDEASGLPSKYLGLFGAEAWGGAGAASWRVHVEYADTVCGFYEDPPEYGCAYVNSIYTDGYQYRDRAIGHAIDGDSEQLAVGASWIRPDGSSFELALQDSRLNRASANAVHSVVPTAARLRSVDFSHRRDLLGGDLRVGVGYEDLDFEAVGGDDATARGFLQWQRRFH